MYDFKLTNDGDLVLGQQQTDEEGFLLYYEDNDNNEGDVILTKDPERGTIPVRDVEVVYNEDAELQLIKSRVHTDNPDWYSYPDIGANLSDLIGEINTPETAEKAKAQIIESLVRDDAFEEADLSVEAVPVSATEILFDIRLRRFNRFVRHALVFNLEIGTMNQYEIKGDM